MTIQDLSNRMTIALKEYISSSKHNKTGEMLNSIQVTANDAFDFNINSVDYILYLDNGDFLPNFFQLDSTISIMEEYYTYDLQKRLSKGLDNSSITVTTV